MKTIEMQADLLEFMMVVLFDLVGFQVQGLVSGDCCATKTYLSNLCTNEHHCTVHCLMRLWIDGNHGVVDHSCNLTFTSGHININPCQFGTLVQFCLRKATKCPAMHMHSLANELEEWVLSSALIILPLGGL